MSEPAEGKAVFSDSVPMSDDRKQSEEVDAIARDFPLVREWMQKILGSTLPSTPTAFFQAIANGELVCQLMLKLRPGSIKRDPDHSARALPFMRMYDNANDFIKACRDECGVAKEHLFEYQDLMKKQDEGANKEKVLCCLLALKERILLMEQQVHNSPSMFSPSRPSSDDFKPAANKLIMTPRKPVGVRRLSVFGRGMFNAQTGDGATAPFTPSRLAASPAGAGGNLARILEVKDTAIQVLTDKLKESIAERLQMDRELQERRSIISEMEKCGLVTLKDGVIISIKQMPASKPKESQQETKATLNRKEALKNGILKPWRLFTHSARHLNKEVKKSMNMILDDFKEYSSQLMEKTREFQARRQLIIDRLASETKKRKRLLNKVIELQGNIRVFCRIRPLSSKEKSNGRSSCITFPSDTVLTLNEGNGRPKSFEFDRVFDPKASQKQVFEDVAPFVQSCIDGYNVCIFAYGQTGSGKTFTMQGPPSNPGVNTRALGELFELISQRREEYSSNVIVSMVEIYNEQPRDLLVTKSQYNDCNKMDIRLGENGPYIPGLTEETVDSVDDVDGLMERAAGNRQVSSTSMNDQSSRSHMILMVTVKSVNLKSGAKSEGKLVLVDLAGSERLKRSEAVGQAKKEAAHINKSLSALGDVISQLKVKSKFVSFRNSKLTYLLQPCLSGHSKCLMFCQASPSDLDSQESMCSLKFAARVRSVELGQAKKNVESGELLKARSQLEKYRGDLKTFREENENLKKRVGSMKSKMSHMESDSSSSAEQLDTLRAREKQLKSRLAASEKQLESLQSLQQKSATNAKEDVQRLAAKCEEMTSKYSKLESQCEQSEQRVAALQAQLSTQKKKAAQATDEKRRLQRELEAARAAVSLNAESKEDTSDKAESDNEQMRRLTEQLEKTMARVAALTKENDALRTASEATEQAEKPEEKSARWAYNVSNDLFIGTPTTPLTSAAADNSVSIDTPLSQNMKGLSMKSKQDTVDTESKPAQRRRGTKRGSPDMPKTSRTSSRTRRTVSSARTTRQRTPVKRSAVVSSPRKLRRTPERRGRRTRSSGSSNALYGSSGRPHSASASKPSTPLFTANTLFQGVPVAETPDESTPALNISSLSSTRRTRIRRRGTPPRSQLRQQAAQQQQSDDDGQDENQAPTPGKTNRQSKRVRFAATVSTRTTKLNDDKVEYVDSVRRIAQKDEKDGQKGARRISKRAMRVTPRTKSTRLGQPARRSTRSSRWM